jgi:hypothetical protein
VASRVVLDLLYQMRGLEVHQCIIRASEMASKGGVFFAIIDSTYNYREKLENTII